MDGANTKPREEKLGEVGEKAMARFSGWLILAQPLKRGVWSIDRLENQQQQ